jgi:hypothetical protein
MEAPILLRPNLKGAAFEPSVIDAITIAFHKTCKVLHVAEDAQLVREIVAKHLMELARRGESDAEKLHARVLQMMVPATAR